jgi:uncharacterized protein YwgA
MQDATDFGLLLTVLKHNPKGEVTGRKRFQKMICILKYRYEIPFSYDFTPYYYGPYSESLASSLDLLVSLAVLTEEKQLLNNDLYQYIYTLTDVGCKLASAISGRLDQNLVNIISTSLNEIQNMNTGDLVNLSKEVLSEAYLSQ